MEKKTQKTEVNAKIERDNVGVASDIKSGVNESDAVSSMHDDEVSVEQNPESAALADEVAAEQSESDALREANAALQEELKAVQAGMLRIRADADNDRRRLLRDIADAKDFAISNFAKDMLRVLEDLRRIKLHGEDGSIETLIEGIKMTIDSFDAALNRNKVTKIEINVGEDVFDAHWHQALVQQVDTSVQSGTILDVAQTGYRIGDRLLQPSLVIVSKTSA